MNAPARQWSGDETLLSHAHAHQERYLADLAALVAVDSGSHSADGVDRVADLVGARLTLLGFDVERVPLPPAHGHRVGGGGGGGGRGGRRAAHGRGGRRGGRAQGGGR
ncbi:hypothetical protein ACFVZL_18970, partial [Streptomyces sp. NPDC058320]